MMLSAYAGAAIIAAVASLLIILGITGHVLLGHLRTRKTTPHTFLPQKSNNSTFPIILNKSYGGFAVSNEGYKLYAKKLGLKLYYYKYVGEEGDTFIYKRYPIEELQKEDLHLIFYFYSTKDLGEYTSERPIDPAIVFNLDEGHREDPVLIEVVRELGQLANTYVSNLKIIDIPISFANSNYTIDNYDGIETLHEKVKHLY